MSLPHGGHEVTQKGSHFPATLRSLCALIGIKEKRYAAGSHPTWQAVVSSLAFSKHFLKLGCRPLNHLHLSKNGHPKFYSQWLTSLLVLGKLVAIQGSNSQHSSWASSPSWYFQGTSWTSYTFFFFSISATKYHAITISSKSRAVKKFSTFSKWQDAIFTRTYRVFVLKIDFATSWNQNVSIFFLVQL